MESLLRALDEPAVQATLRYLTTVFGAAAMYIFSLNKGFEGAIAWLRRMVPGRPQVFYDRVDFVIVVMAGSIIGTISFSPAGTFEALAAGFGWVGSMQVLMNRASAEGNG
jgi:hypothetical protein